MMQEGYNKCYSIFRVPMLTHWEYIVIGKSRTLEVASAPDDQLSFLGATDDVRLRSLSGYF
jgi:hypothetical protein